MTTPDSTSDTRVEARVAATPDSADRAVINDAALSSQGGSGFDQLNSVEEFEQAAGAALNAGTAGQFRSLASAYQSAIDGLKHFQDGFASAAKQLDTEFQGAAGDKFQDFATNQV